MTSSKPNIFNPARDLLLKKSELLKLSYSQSEPYPHLVIDDLFNTEILDCIIHEFPLHQDLDELNWEITSDLKLRTVGVSRLSDFAQTFYFWLNSQDFIRVISSIVEQDNLVGDPLLYGAGLYEILPGGRLEIIGDRLTHPTLPLVSQFNLIICLNRYWNPSCGGAIELQNSQDAARKVSYASEFNRTVIIPIRSKTVDSKLTFISHQSDRSFKFLSNFYWAVIPT